jgi:putative hydrolase of the HAD superfamily
MRLFKECMVKYNHVFFDLDRTIWDFEKNSEETIFELLNEFGLSKKGKITEADFIKTYKTINQGLWVDYRSGKISKTELRKSRFYLSMLKYGLDEAELALRFNDAYVSRCSSKTHLLPHSREILHYLSKSYILHIITNGFKEAQHLKLEKSGIRPYFNEVIIGDEVGINKPDPRIFHFAFESSTADPNESIMIGDDYEADIIGAKEVGMDQIFLNAAKDSTENKIATYTVSHLEELRRIL